MQEVLANGMASSFLCKATCAPILARATCWRGEHGLYEMLK